MTDLLASLDTIALAPDAQALLFTEARTANSFTDEPVTAEQLQAIHELTKYGPTAANTLPLRILYIDTQEGRDRLIPLMAEGNQEKTRTAPLVAVVAADTDFHEFIPKTFPIRPELKDGLAGDPEGREKMARFNAALQAGYFLLAIRAVGLAAGPMAGFDTAGVEREFFPDGRWKALMVVNIGKPGESQFPRLPRLDYDEVHQHV